MIERNELLITRVLVAGAIVGHLASSGMTALSGESLPSGQNEARAARPSLYIGMSWPGVVPAGQAVSVAIPDAARCPYGLAGAAAVAGKPGHGVVTVNQVSGGVAARRGAVIFGATAIGMPSGMGMWLNHNDVVQFVFPADADLSDVAITLKCEREMSADREHSVR